MDLYAVGIEVRSDGVLVASQRLREAQRELGRTETATERMERSARNSATSLRQMGSAISALHGPLGGVASRFRSMGTLIGQTGLILGAFTIALGAVALTARRVFREYISETIEAERSTLRLEQALRSSADTSGHSLASVKALTQQFRNLTTFSTNSIQSVQAALLSFRNVVGDILPRATKATLDFAQALGRDATSAAHTIGQAMNDPIGAMRSLTSAGVRFTQSQTAMIRNLVISGQGFKAQGVILQALEKQYGGVAEAARNTLGGALAALSNAWDDLFRVEGRASETLRNAIQSLEQALRSPVFVEFAQSAGALLFRTLSALTGAMEAFAGVLPGAIRAITAFGAAWAVYMAPRVFTGTASAIATWAAGTTVAITTLTGVFRVFVGTAVGVLVGAMQAVVLGLARMTAAFMRNPIGFIATAVTAAAATAVGAVFSLRDSIVPLGQGIATFGDYVSAAWETVKSSTFEMVSSVAASIDKAFGTNTQQFVHEFFNDLATSAIRAAATAVNAFLGMRYALQNLRETIRTRNFFGEGEGVREAFQRGWNEDILGDWTKKAEDIARVRKATNDSAAASTATGQMGSFEIFNEGRASDFERTIAQMRQRTQQLQHESNVVGLATFASEKYLATQQLIQAAQADGVRLTDEVLRQIDAEATALARNTASYEAAIEAQRRLDDIRGTFQSSMSGFATDIARGTSALDSLASALQRVADKLIDMAVNDLFGQAFGKPGTAGGLFGALAGFLGGGSTATTSGWGATVTAGVLHAGGIAGNDNVPTRAVSATAFANAQRYHTGGIAGRSPFRPNEVPAILERGEEVLTRRDPRHRDNGGGGAPGNMTINVNVEGANGDAHVRALVQEGVISALTVYPRSAAFQGGVIASVRNARDRNAI